MALKGSPILTIIALAISFLVIVPIGFLIFGMFWTTSPGLPGELTLEYAQEGFAIGEHATLLLNTGIFAGGSTILAIGIGVALALVLKRTDTPGRKFFDAVILVHFVFPSFLGDIAWTMLLSPRHGLLNYQLMRLFGLESAPFNIYTHEGMIWSQGIGLAALAYLLIHPAVANMDPVLEEAARISGASIKRSIGKVTLPILFPSILATALLLFMISLRSFETPTFIGQPGGIKVYMNAIYENIELVIPSRYGVASTQATVLLVLMLVVVVLYLQSTKRLSKYVSITGRGYKPRVIHLGRWKFATLAFAGGYIFLSTFMPFILLFFVSLVPFYATTRNMLENMTLANYTQVLLDELMISGAINSTLIAVSAAVVTTMAGAFLAYMAFRTRIRGKRVFEAIAILPMGYPGLVFGLALLWTFLTVFRPIFGTPWALVIAYMVIFLPLSMRSLSNTMMQVHTELEEAGATAGASWMKTMRLITLPLMKPAIINTFILILVYAYREVGTAVMLAGPGMYVVPVLILFWWRSGYLPVVAAATLIYGGLMVMTLLVARFLLTSRGKSA